MHRTLKNKVLRYSLKEIHMYFLYVLKFLIFFIQNYPHLSSQVFKPYSGPKRGERHWRRCGVSLKISSGQCSNSIIILTGKPFHYSKLSFFDCSMIKLSTFLNDWETSKQSDSFEIIYEVNSNYIYIKNNIIYSKFSITIPIVTMIFL